MPANLTPQYMAAEERFKKAESAAEKIEALREMQALLPKHKGTEKLQADLKRRLSKLVEEQEHRRRAGGARHHDPGHVAREGAGQIAIAGPPNSGKSSLLAALTHAHPEIADYPFTTHAPQPGMMPFEDVQVQLVDTPPFAHEPFDPVIVNVARGADAIAVVLDPTSAEPLADAEAVPRFLARARVVPAGRAVPVELGNSAHVLPVVLLLGKADLAVDAETEALLREAAGADLPWQRISCRSGAGLEALRGALFGMLSIVRVYAKEPSKKPDLSRPFVLRRGATVLDLAALIHKDLAAHFRFARLWGSSRFGGQPVERDHVLADRDVVELHA
jgi:hypothetical protein